MPYARTSGVPSPCVSYQIFVRSLVLAYGMNASWSASQLALRDLARCVAWQPVEDRDRTRILVCRQPFPAPGDQLLGAGRGARTQRDERRDVLTELGVGDADDRGFGHRRMRREHAL